MSLQKRSRLVLPLLSAIPVFVVFETSLPNGPTHVESNTLALSSLNADQRLLCFKEHLIRGSKIIG